MDGASVEVASGFVAVAPSPSWFCMTEFKMEHTTKSIRGSRGYKCPIVPTSCSQRCLEERIVGIES